MPNGQYCVPPAPGRTGRSRWLLVAGRNDTASGPVESEQHDTGGLLTIVISIQADVACFAVNPAAIDQVIRARWRRVPFDAVPRLAIHNAQVQG